MESGGWGGGGGGGLLLMDFPHSVAALTKLTEITQQIERRK